MGAGQRRRLQQTLASLQREWDLRAQKVERLRKAIGIETHPSRAFELEQNLAEEEADLTTLDDRIREIEQQLEQR